MLLLNVDTLRSYPTSFFLALCLIHISSVVVQPPKERQDTVIADMGRLQPQATELEQA
jgi:hypothetical protein